jgi:hypothetical protein
MPAKHSSRSTVWKGAVLGLTIPPGNIWASVVLSEALIFGPYKAFAVDSFEPANGEMTPSHLLKMLDKRVVHGSAA